MVADLDASSPAYTLAFQDGAALVAQGTGVVVAWAGHNLPVRRGSPGLTAALAALAAGGATEAAMVAAVTAQDGEDGLPVLYLYLERFQQLGLLTYGLCDQASLLATLVPHARFAAGRQLPAVVPGTPDPGARYVLSRFACLRREADRLVLESPLAPGSVVIHDPRAAALCQTLAQPRTVAELSEGASREATVLLLGLLLGCRAATIEGPGGQDSREALSMWSFHDLMLHIRSRSGRTAEPVGATFRLAGRIAPSPAVKPRMQGARIELYRPDVEALKAHDVPLTRVLEERRSVRTHASVRSMCVRSGSCSTGPRGSGRSRCPPTLDFERCGIVSSQATASNRLAVNVRDDNKIIVGNLVERNVGLLNIGVTQPELLVQLTSEGLEV